MIEFNTNLVLVTGALGWLGINLVESLVKGLADFEPLSQPLHITSCHISHGYSGITLI